MEQNIVVSVVCNAFNHGKYIAQALESFVTQKTEFSFEVLVHDDASTDETAEIIRQYAEKYPEIVKPWYQTENQYSKHTPITRKFQYARAQGKYLAWCEGDDYWTDPLKLQKQVDALEKYPEADICAHRSVTVRDGVEGKAYPEIPKDCLLTADQVINGGGAFVSTNSLMFRRSLIDSRFDYTDRYNLDFVLQISGSLRGGMVFLKDVMAAYRVMSEGSWTQKNKNNTAWFAKHRQKLKGVLEQIDADTEYVHTVSLKKCIAQMVLKQLAAEGKLGALLAEEQRAAMATQPLFMRMKLLAFAALRKIRK